MGKPIEKQTLADTIYDSIKMDIIKRNLIPGQKINTKELAHRYGASETPVKLALNRLISEKVVENFPRQGMRIKDVNQREAEETFEIRKMMELYYAKEIIDAVTTSKFLREALIKNVDENYKVLELYEKEQTLEFYTEYYLLDNQFHELYLKCSGNEKLIDVYRSMNPFVYSYYVFSRQSFERIKDGLDEHKRIVDSILCKDEKSLREAIALHMDNAKRVICLILKTEKMI